MVTVQRVLGQLPPTMIAPPNPKTNPNLKSNPTGGQLSGYLFKTSSLFH